MPRQASTTSVTSTQDAPARPRHSVPGKVWSLSCLRPSPPLRPGLSLREDKRNQRYKRKDDKWHEDDALILRVIEAYCTSAKTRYTINSIDLGHVGRACGGSAPGGSLIDCRGHHHHHHHYQQLSHHQYQQQQQQQQQQQTPPHSPPALSPFGELRMHKGQRSNWCCGLAIKAIKKNIDFDC